MNIELIQADYNNPEQAKNIITVLQAYVLNPVEQKKN
jgi:hypothetical protein